MDNCSQQAQNSDHQQQKASNGCASDTNQNNTNQKNTAKGNTEPKVQSESADKKGTWSYSTVLFWPLILLLIWHWDGFWQIKIPPILNLQKQYFPEKLLFEQLKLHNLGKNLEIVNDLQDNIKALKKELVEKRNDARNYELSCRYVDSAVRIIDNLKLKVSHTGLGEPFSCTNKECEEIKKISIRPLKICSEQF